MFFAAFPRCSARGVCLVFAARLLADVCASSSADVEPAMAEPLPRDYHNLFVVVVVTLLLAWGAKVAHQLVRVADVSIRFARSQPLHLEGMSVYAADFQMLIRQHFNQILRIRRTVPPKPVARHSLSAHLHPDSISICESETPRPQASGRRFGVQFTIDAASPCCVKLFWGVSISACNDFVRAHADRPAARDAGGPLQRGVRWGTRQGAAAPPQDSQRSLLEMEELSGSTTPGTAGAEDSRSLFPTGQFVAQSRDFFLPAGVSQRYVTPGGDLVEPSSLAFDLTAGWLREGSTAEDSGVMPLAIVVVAQKRPSAELGDLQGRPIIESNGQVSFVKFRSAEEASQPTAAEVVRQVCFSEKAHAREVQGVYGFEGEGDEDCMICYARAKNVLLLPCRHCSVCHACLRSLRDEKCPLCRSAFSAYITFPMNRNGSGGTPTGAAAGTQAPGPSNGSGHTLLPAAPDGDGASDAGEDVEQGTSTTSQDTAAAPGAAVQAASSAAGTSAAAALKARERTARAVVEGAEAGGRMSQPDCKGASEKSGVSGVAVADAGITVQSPAEPSRSAREAPFSRPRGVAPASRTAARGLRASSGRARPVSETSAPPPSPADADDDAPLLASPDARGLPPAASDKPRRDVAEGLPAEAAAEETSTLMHEAEVV
eukprot:TRINITY_DN64556_c0_g1_i1.p1 TRINITY_DN64556_c0_g1~~TRINITY_DN64556_c0_g1_i1.p1  ORF type:complete len:658 (-),score=128.58 TRINITY_DN64556_c0_g1_i1:166-2139(-)